MGQRTERAEPVERIRRIDRGHPPGDVEASPRGPEAFEERMGRRIQSARRSRDLSARELARRSGVGLSTLYKIEAGKTSPTVTTLAKLARALGSTVGHLAGEDPERPDVAFHRPGDGEAPVVEGHGVVGTLVGAGLEAPQMLTVVLELAEGGRSGAEALKHDGEELVLCLKGRVEYRVGEGRYVLTPGCTLQYKSYLPHAWRNLSRGASRVLVVMTPPPVFTGRSWHGFGLD